jgi:hypothetical protein
MEALSLLLNAMNRFLTYSHGFRKVKFLALVFNKGQQATDWAARKPLRVSASVFLLVSALLFTNKIERAFSAGSRTNRRSISTPSALYLS